MTGGRRHPIAVGLYRAALRLHPRAFRQRFAAPMESSFVRLLDEARGPADRARITIREMLDLALVRLTGRSTFTPPATAGLAAIGSDLRLAFRALVARPGFAAVTIGVIGLGVGSAVAIYSVMHEVLLKPLPYAEPDRIVFALESSREFPGRRLPVSPRVFDAWAETSALAQIAGYRPESPVLRVGEYPERLEGGAATPGTFEMLGVPALVGSTALGDHGVLLSEGFWRRAFGADPDIVGEELEIDGISHVVVGVMPADFHYPFTTRADVWRSFTPDPARLDQRQFMVTAKLAPGVSVEAAERQLGAIVSAVAAERGEEMFDYAAVDDPRAWSVDRIGPILRLLAGAAGLLLVIVAVNLGALGFTRGLSRSRELAIRAAIGAGTLRLVRLQAIESLVLAAAGGVLGIAVAAWGVAALRGLIPLWPPSLVEATVGARAALVGMALSLLLGTALGVFPGLRLSRADLATGLREGGHSTGEGARRQRLRSGLVVMQLAAALVLLFGASLIVRSVVNLLSVDLGFEPGGVVTVRVGGGAADDPDAWRAQAARTFETIVPDARLAQVTYADAAPRGPGDGDWVRIVVEGEVAQHAEANGAWVRRIGPDYLDLLRIPLHRGRPFTRSEQAGDARVALVNQRFVDLLLGGRDPIGLTIETMQPLGMGEEILGSIQIIGVTGDTLEQGAGGHNAARLLVPFAQEPRPAFTLLMRPRGAADGLRDEVREAVAGIGPDLLVGSLAGLEESFASAHRTQRFVLTVLGAFAVTAAALALVGLYGVIAQNVASRTHEFAVRRALGAEAGRIRTLVVRSGLALGLAGVVMGVLLIAPAGLAARGVLSAGLLEGLAWWDPLTVLAVPLGLLVVVAAASALPARRAARIEPRVALGGDA